MWKSAASVPLSAQSEQVDRFDAQQEKLKFRLGRCVNRAAASWLPGKQPTCRAFIKIIGVYVRSAVYAFPWRVFGINVADEESAQWPFVLPTFLMQSGDSLDAVQVRTPRGDVRCEGYGTVNH